MCYSRDQRYVMLCSVGSEHYHYNLSKRFSDAKFDTDIARNNFYEPEASKEFLKSAPVLFEALHHMVVLWKHPWSRWFCWTHRMRTSLGFISDNGHYNDLLLHNGRKTLRPTSREFPAVTWEPFCCVCIQEHGACFLLSVHDDSEGDSGRFQDKEIIIPSSVFILRIILCVAGFCYISC